MQCCCGGVGVSFRHQQSVLGSGSSLFISSDVLAVNASMWLSDMIASFMQSVSVRTYVCTYVVRMWYVRTYVLRINVIASCGVTQSCGFLQQSTHH